MLFEVVGAAFIGILTTFLLVVNVVFFIRSEDITYNPCCYNLFKDDYRNYIITGVVHSIATALFAVLQLFAYFFTEYIAVRLHGSVQIFSLVPTLGYYHLLVVNYQYRSLEVCNRGHYDLKKNFCTEFFAGMTFFIISGFAGFLFCAESQYPYGIYFHSHIDPSSGWHMDDYILGCYAVAIMGAAFLTQNLFRIIRSSHRIRHRFNEPDDTNLFWFRYFISRGIAPHLINDFILLYIPTLYLLVRSTPLMRLNEFDVLAKCMMIAHPLVFTVIYMSHIKMATRKADMSEMFCPCCVCSQKKTDQENPSNLYMRFISFLVMKTTNRTIESGSIASRRHRECRTSARSTETTRAIYDIQVSENL